MTEKPYWLGHRERLRKRARPEQFEFLRPYEVIELLLTYVIPRRDLAPVARSLISAFGSVDGVLSATYEQLTTVQGVTKRMADWLLITRELVDAYTGIRPASQMRVFRYPDLLSFIVPRRPKVRPPQLWVLYTDLDDRVLCFNRLGDCLSCGDKVQYKKLMETSLLLEARFVYLIGFAGGDALTLYPEEVEKINALVNAMHSVDVEMVDYVLAGDETFLSACKSGVLDEQRQTEEVKCLRERYVAENTYEGDEDNVWDRELYEGEP